MSVEGSFVLPEEAALLLASRPLLEARVRQRVRALANVTVLDGHDVVDFDVDAGRVTGVRVANRADAAGRSLACDLVVDATGRSARLPAFLAAHGYPVPREHRYAVGLSYSSQFFRVPATAMAEKVAVSARPLERATGAGVLTYEDDTVILTLIGLAGHRPPTELPAVLDAVTDVLPARMVTALRNGEPLGPVAAQHYPTSVWRRYDTLDRFPDGLLAIGDAVCGFNPMWGQGMTSAVLQATALQQCLAEGTDDLSRRYFRAAARRLAPIWRSNRVVDFAVIPADGGRAVPKRALNLVMSLLWRAAARDVRVTETWIRSIELLDPPTVWLRPSTVRRIVVGAVRSG
jgi:2-polyprenyl-6-methoxyphenol hydroxylase-like FAD-dependent oxidoreductase